jgi:hypothetical protein
MMKLHPTQRLSLMRQRGIALPVMLLMMLMMLATSIFLIKSINSTTLMAGNLAYESALSKQADLGLATGFAWLTTTATNNKAAFNSPHTDQGYHPQFDTTLTPKDTDFWTDSRTVEDPLTNTKVEYVIHRLCFVEGAYDQMTPTLNKCVKTSTVLPGGSAAPIGSSLGGGFVADPPPLLHYVVTSRIFAPRGGYVVNQLVVLIDG